MKFPGMFGFGTPGCSVLSNVLRPAIGMKKKTAPIFGAVLYERVFNRVIK